MDLICDHIVNMEHQGSNDDLSLVSPTSVVDNCGEYEIHKICIDINSTITRSRNNLAENSNYSKIGVTLKKCEWLNESMRHAFPKQSSYTFIAFIEKDSLGYKAGIKCKDVLCWPRDDASIPIVVHDLFSEMPCHRERNKNSQINRRSRYQNHAASIWSLISENDISIQWQKFKQSSRETNEDKNNDILSRNESSGFYFYIARKIEKYQSTPSDVLLVSSPLSIVAKTRGPKVKSAVTSPVLTQYFIDSRITSSYQNITELEQSSILSDAQDNAKQNYQQAYDKIINSLPTTYKQRWGEMYFVRWEKSWLPGLVVNPVTHVAPGATRDQWYQNYFQVSFYAISNELRCFRRFQSTSYFRALMFHSNNL
jgi:hypothetical protein